MKHSYIYERVEDGAPFEGARLLTLKTSLKGVVFFSGSILGGSIFSPKDSPCLAYFVSRMLDQSTKRKSKEKIREGLSMLGATLSFSRSTFRVHFSGRCRSDDLDKVTDIASECLRQPKFDKKEFELVKRLIISELEEAKDDTNGASLTALVRELFHSEHPNYSLTPEEAIGAIKKISLEDVKKFHVEHYGLGSLIVTIGGDVSRGDAEKILKKHFGDWKKVALKIPKIKPAGRGEPKEIFKTFRDKASVDCYMGAALHIDREHKDFHPLVIAFSALGGSAFSSRLFKEVREKKGLTYHTRATMSGLEPSVDGFWYAYGVFAPQLFEKGRAAIIESLKSWYRGLSLKELESKKKYIAGSHLVRLSSVNSLVAAIQTTAENNRPIKYLDDYPKIICDLSLAKVNGAIKKHINFNRLVISAAGSIDKNGRPLKK